MIALLHLMKITHTILEGKSIDVYTRFSAMEWLFMSKELYRRAFSFAALLSPFHLNIKSVKEHDVDFAQLLQASITPYIGLDESLRHITPPAKHSSSVRLGPELFYARVPPTFVVVVLLLDGSAKTEKLEGFGSCSWILWQLPEWTILIAASAYLSTQ